jgi:hypothetical protein
MAKKPAKQKEPTQQEKVFVLVPNVWVDGVKWFQHDVMEIDANDADLLVGNKQAKKTKDDITHVVDVDGKRSEV